MGFVIDIANDIGGRACVIGAVFGRVPHQRDFWAPLSRSHVLSLQRSRHLLLPIMADMRMFFTAEGGASSVPRSQSVELKSAPWATRGSAGVTQMKSCRSR